MKKILLALLLLSVIFSGCSDDDGVQKDENLIGNSQINVTAMDNTNHYCRGQILRAALNPKPKQTITYLWDFSGGDSDKGFTSNGDTLNLYPQQAGKYTINLTVSKGSKSQKLSKDIQVEQGDYRFTFWGQDILLAIGGETTYNAIHHQKTPAPDINGTDYLNEYIFKSLDYPYVEHHYFVDRNNLVYEGYDYLKFYISDHTSTNKEPFFEHFVNEIIKNYGSKPSSAKIITTNYPNTSEEELSSYNLTIRDICVYGKSYKVIWSLPRVNITATAKDGGTCIIYKLLYEKK